LVISGTGYFGDVEELFGDNNLSHLFTSVRKIDFEQIQDIWKEELPFIIMLGIPVFYPSELSQIILKNSYIKQSQQSLGFLRNLAHNFYPVINFSIRNHNRVLLNFQEILQKTIDELSSRYEKPAIIIDGICENNSLERTILKVDLNKPGKYILVDNDLNTRENTFQDFQSQLKYRGSLGRANTQQLNDVLSQELGYVQSLFNEIANEKCTLISIVGLNIFDAICTLRFCDLFVSNYTGGVVKQSLIANLPGIIHGPSAFIAHAKRRPEFFARQDISEFILPILPTYEEKKAGIPPINCSYKIDYDSFREKLFALLNVIELTARRGNPRKW
jgi:hypothetical protein